MTARHYIGNEWIDGSSGAAIPVIDPSDGRAFDEIARGTAADVDRAVAAARTAIGPTFEGAWGCLGRSSAAGF
jgi:aldehyde dehydrogenase (NAD+)